MKSFATKIMDKRVIGLIAAWFLSLGGAFLFGQYSSHNQSDTLLAVGNDNSDRSNDFNDKPTRDGKRPPGIGSPGSYPAGSHSKRGASNKSAPSIAGGGNTASGGPMLGGARRLSADRSGRGGQGNSGNQLSGLAGTAVDILRMSDRYQRKNAFHQLMEQMGPDNVQDIAKVFENMKAQGLPLGSEYTEFAYRWGKQNGQEALEYLAKQEAPDWASGAATEALRGWAQNDSQGAGEWVNQLGEGKWNETVVRGYVRGLAEQDVAAARKFALSMRGKTDLAPLFSDIYGELLQNRGLAQAQTWFESLPPGDLHIKRQLFDELTISKLRAGTSEALDWINQNANAAYRDDLAVRRVAAHLTNENPAAALDWVLNLSPSPDTNQRVGIGEVINVWPKEDFDGLGSALSDRQGQPGYDEAAAQFAYRINNIDDEAALTWAATIGDENFRNVVLKRLNRN